MAIRDQLKPSGPRTDKVTRALGALDPKDREAVEQALADPNYRNVDISGVLSANGYDVDERSVRYYRQKEGLL